jgi:hypothetical protein
VITGLVEVIQDEKISEACKTTAFFVLGKIYLPRNFRAIATTALGLGVQLTDQMLHQVLIAMENMLYLTRDPGFTEEISKTAHDLNSLEWVLKFCDRSGEIGKTARRFTGK